MALTISGQADFGGGIYRGKNAPPNALYDAVNVLISDESLLYRRGGSTYISTSDAGHALGRIIAPYMPIPDTSRVLAWGSASHLYEVSGPAPLDLGVLSSLSRAAIVGDYVVLATTSSLGFYAGSLKSATYSAGTVSVATGSRTVTGVGTAWLANADPGILFTNPLSVGDPQIAVESVDSNTQLTLRTPWTSTPLAGAIYQLKLTSTRLMSTLIPSFVGTGGPYVCAAGTVPRLIAARGNRAYFTPAGQIQSFDANDYHELTEGVETVGAIGVGDTAVMFTTGGISLIENLDFDPVDAAGNVQQRVTNPNKDINLWGDLGLAAWRGALVVPALDDVWLFSLSGEVQQISGSRFAHDGGIRSLYRSYVAAGYQPGYASVFRGHYFLPILDSSQNRIDTLVCRLDAGYGWTRWSGHGAASSFTQYNGASAPKLYGVNGQRAIDLTACFDPAAANATEADGTVPDCTIITRDFPTGGNQPGTVDRIRGRYELVNNGAGSTPTVAVAYSSDQDAGAFTTLSSFGSEDGGTGGATSDGSEYSWWKVGKRRAKIRYRITQTGAAASFVWRSLEMLTRQSSNR